MSSLERSVSVGSVELKRLEVRLARIESVDMRKVRMET